MLRTLALCLCLTQPASACDTALLLAIDVSGSIDKGEYALQISGLYDALQDPEITEILLQGQSALAVVQWSGLGRQSLVQPWQRMRSAQDLARFVQTTRNLPRAFTGSDTAVGQAISFAAAQFAAVPDCTRHIIDISGDGPENAGHTTARARRSAIAQNITINVIAFEDMGVSSPITSFYKNWVITPKGFAITARGLDDYPRAIRAKLLQELVKPTG